MKRAFVLGCLVLAAGLRPASAQQVQNIVLRNSFNPVGAGARGVGMGGAFIAVADDGSAASFNPAGLAQLRRSELAFVGFGGELESTQQVVRPDAPETLVRKDSHRSPDFFGLAVPFEVGGRNLTLQASYQRAVDLFGRGTAVTFNRVAFRDIGVDAPGLVDLVGDISPEQSGALHTMSLAGGYQLTNRLSLGVSLNYWIGDWDTTGTTNFRALAALVRGQPATELYRLRTDFAQDHSLRGVNLNLGFLLRYARLSIGGVARLPFAGDYELQEDVKSTLTQIGQPPASSQETPRTNTVLNWPRSAGIGIAFRPFRGFTLAADYSTSNWSGTTVEDVPDGVLLTEKPEADETGQVPPPVFVDRNFFDLLPASQTATVDTNAARVGIEYLVLLPKVVIPLRVGAFADVAPVADLASDKGRQIDGFTIGTGLNFSALVFDFAFEERKSSGAVGVRLRGGEVVNVEDITTEQVRERRFVASVIYRLPEGDRDWVKRVLRGIFVGGS